MTETIIVSSTESPYKMFKHIYIHHVKENDLVTNTKNFSKWGHFCSKEFKNITNRIKFVRSDLRNQKENFRFFLVYCYFKHLQNKTKKVEVHFIMLIQNVPHV